MKSKINYDVHNVLIYNIKTIKCKMVTADSTERTPR